MNDWTVVINRISGLPNRWEKVSQMLFPRPSSFTPPSTFNKNIQMVIIDGIQLKLLCNNQCMIGWSNNDSGNGLEDGIMNLNGIRFDVATSTWYAAVAVPKTKPCGKLVRERLLLLVVVSTYWELAREEEERISRTGIKSVLIMVNATSICDYFIIWLLIARINYTESLLVPISFIWLYRAQMWCPHSDLLVI